MPSARRSRRISDQSSTPNTPLPPQLDNEPGSSSVVSLRLPEGGQFPRAVDTVPCQQRAGKRYAYRRFPGRRQPYVVKSCALVRPQSASMSPEPCPDSLVEDWTRVLMAW
jgi:hypothetical protein